MPFHKSRDGTDHNNSGDVMKLLAKYVKKTIIGALLAGASLGAMANTTITFDDLVSDTDGIEIADGYAGLNWDNFYVLNGTDYGAGYAAGVVSGSNVALNWYDHPASFSNGAGFNLVSLYVTKAWYSGVTHIEGYSGSSLVYSADVTSSTTSPTFVSLNWVNVTNVVISDGDASYHSAIDNITIAAVPEPETYAMLLAGLGLVGVAARRRQKQA